MKNLLEKAIITLSTQIIDQADKISAAYIDNDDELSINLSVKLKGSHAGVEIKTGVSFVERRTKDERVEIVDPEQLQLFDKPDLRLTK